MTVRSFIYYKGPARIHCNLDLDDMILGQGHDSPWGMDNNCMEYFLNPTRQEKFMAWKRQTQMIDEQADRNGDSSILPYFIKGGGGGGNYLKCLYLECLW